MYGLGQTTSVPVMAVPAAASSTVVQIGSLGFTSGSVMVYGGTAAALLAALLLPDDNPLKTPALIAGVGAAGFLIFFWSAASNVH